jgi:hypothetical protein
MGEAELVPRPPLPKPSEASSPKGIPPPGGRDFKTESGREFGENEEAKSPPWGVWGWNWERQ